MRKIEEGIFLVGRGIIWLVGCFKSWESRVSCRSLLYIQLGMNELIN